MRYAGHLPTQRFTLAEVTAMAVGRCHEMAPTGFSRWVDPAGKMIVTFFDGGDLRGAYSVRPIIRVRAEGKAA
jgi:hypothetical protein